MASLGFNPPQPLSDAKEAAVSFIKQLGSSDRVGIISFATESTEPMETTLTNDFSSAQKMAESVGIEASSTQYTNIYEPLHFAWQELVSARSGDKNSKIVILLTDGVANNPRDPQGKTEADDIKIR